MQSMDVCGHGWTVSPAVCRPPLRRRWESLPGVPLDPRCPALSRIRFFLGIGGTVERGVWIAEFGMEEGKKRRELREFSRKGGLIEPSGRHATKPAPRVWEEAKCRIRMCFSQRTRRARRETEQYSGRCSTRSATQRAPTTSTGERSSQSDERRSVVRGLQREKGGRKRPEFQLISGYYRLFQANFEGGGGLRASRLTARMRDGLVL